MGIQMQKTAILTHVMKAAVPHFSFAAVALRSAMMAIRFMMICSSN